MRRAERDDGPDHRLRGSEQLERPHSYRRRWPGAKDFCATPPSIFRHPIQTRPDPGPILPPCPHVLDHGLVGTGSPQLPRGRRPPQANHPLRRALDRLRPERPSIRTGAPKAPCVASKIGPTPSRRHRYDNTTRPARQRPEEGRQPAGSKRSRAVRVVDAQQPPPAVPRKPPPDAVGLELCEAPHPHPLGGTVREVARTRLAPCLLEKSPQNFLRTRPEDPPTTAAPTPTGYSNPHFEVQPLASAPPDVLMRRDPSVTLEAGRQIATFPAEAGQPVHPGGIGSTSRSKRLCHPQTYASPLRFLPCAINCLASLIRLRSHRPFGCGRPRKPTLGPTLRINGPRRGTLRNPPGQPQDSEPSSSDP